MNEEVYILLLLFDCFVEEVIIKVGVPVGISGARESRARFCECGNIGNVDRLSVRILGCNERDCICQQG